MLQMFTRNVRGRVRLTRLHRRMEELVLLVQMNLAELQHRAQLRQRRDHLALVRVIHAPDRHQRVGEQRPQSLVRDAVDIEPLRDMRTHRWAPLRMCTIAVALPCAAIATGAGQ